MKKYILLILMILLLATGCKGQDLANVKEDFVKNVEKRTSYLMKGTMTIISNEDTFTYDISAAREDDNYRVNLVNQLNDHEQVLLRTANEVYVVTPSLNKSFKFQSEWPSNGSQAYLIDSLKHDIKSDAESTVKQIEKGYIITAKVNYPNNANLTCEKIYLDEDGNIEKVEVLDEAEKVKITVLYQSIDYSPKFEDKYFELESMIEEEIEVPEDESVSGIIEDIIFPLYVPVNTYLANKDSVETSDGNRVILTFAGDTPFTLVEEVSKIKKEFEIIPVYGEPIFLQDSVGALTGNSLRWTSENIDYFISSDSLSSFELLTIAQSMSNSSIPVAKAS